MGRQTRFHPVSLNILRGAAEYAGFKLGRIKQISPPGVSDHAKYIVPLLELPFDCQKQELLVIAARLNSAYAADVLVTNVWATYGGKIYAVLETCVRGGEEGENPPESELSWLVDGAQ